MVAPNIAWDIYTTMSSRIKKKNGFKCWWRRVFFFLQSQRWPSKTQSYPKTLSYFHITFISTKEPWTTLQWLGIFSFCCFYPENSCLWNRKSDSYKNQQLRWKTLEHLRILLSAHPPPVNFTGEVGAGSFLKLHYNKHKAHAIVSF